ncbi:MAG TPA: choice-of-anchor D domain-containing protein [Verrucomicrobiae bacterium]|nr:choice-of-anchor D domain-containing protein [Verrucomicrobiae bacterium]
MKFSRMWLFALAGMAGLFLMARHGRAVTVATTDNKISIYQSADNKVIIYPTGDEKIDQLKEKGIQKVKNYGSYWLVEATDAQVEQLTQLYGDRAVKDSRFNRIQLNGTSIDTLSGEPTVPANLREEEGPGKHLRLVQFRGSVTPEWLQLLRSSGAQIISYVPNNAYLVLMDATVERKLEVMRGPSGSIQWVGAYHPYYKMPRSLLAASGTDPIKVRVTAVDRFAETHAASKVIAMGDVASTMTHTGQKTYEMEVLPSAISQIAELSDVIWIEQVERKVRFDEVQDLILAGQTNGLGNGPSTTMGITNYLDFLVNSVGGGLSSFFDPFTYAIVDVADTGIDVINPLTGNIVQPSLIGHVAYAEPGLGGYFVGSSGDSGCAALNNNFFGTEDFYDHGTRVASVIAGFDVATNDFNQFSIFSTIVTQVFSVTNVCAGAGAVTNTFVLDTQPCNLTTDIIFNCTSAGSFPVNIPLPTEVIVTQIFDSVHQDPSGFRLGLGVSPFGLIGSSRIWRQSADTTGNPPHVRFLPNPQQITPCMNGSFPLVFFAAYSAGGRIQNNSWGDDINTNGSNGGAYSAESQAYDIGVRDALLAGNLGNGGNTNGTPGPSPLNQEFIIVFAGASILSDAGVAGINGGFGDLRITPPATAKNVITVTASESVRLDGSGCDVIVNEDNSFDMWQDSAFGPTLDGRIKPEIVAPGSSIYAARSLLAGAIDPVLGIVPVVNLDPNGNPGGNFIFSSQVTNLYCVPPQPFTNFFPNLSQGFVQTSGSAVGGQLYDCNSGSSYAAPAVSGAIQLLWWYFQHRLTNEVGQALLQPSPAMAKAYVCNSARYMPLTNPQTGATDTLPSIAQGMGELDLARMFDGAGRMIRDESTPRAIDVALITTNPSPQQTYFSQSGQSYEASGQVLDPSLPFRVTLAWVDAPGAQNASSELVNDLDLQVTVGGVTYKGNVFSEDHSVPGGAFDDVNNMESVFLPAGQTGAWSIIVRAKNIAGDGVPNVGGSNDQDFALIVYNAATNTLSDIPNLKTNNSCQTALLLTQFPTSFSNTLSKAVYTGNTMPSPSAGRGGVEEFFRIVQPTPGTTFTVNTQGSAFNTILSVWNVQVLPQTVFVRGNCGALTELVSTNGGFNSQVSFTADGSNDYYVVAEPLNNGSGGNFVLNVSASASPITITPSSLTFGQQVILTTSSPQTATYRNGSTVPVQISNLSITGPDAADFSVTSETCEGSVLTPSQNCFVTVVFTPQVGPVGSRQANLVFTDDATGSPRVVPLNGTATAAAPIVCLSSSGTLDFGNQLLTTTSAVQTITLTNCGSADLNIASITISGSGSNDFSFGAGTTCAAPSTITPGSTCTIAIQFNPQAVGSRKANLLIAHDATGSPTIIPLSGVGAALLPSICFSSSSIDFGGVAVGSTGSVVSVTITNCGTAVLTNSSLTLTGANPGDFITNSAPCGSVATGGTCVISLQFAPTAGGSRSANLGFVDNASGSPQLLPLIGNGALSQPDAAIGKTVKVKRMVGAGIENSNGAGQEITKPIRRGARSGLKFFVSLQNIGTTSDRFTVQGDSGSTGFTVHYFLGAVPNDSVEVTSAVESGVFSTSTLAPGATISPATMIRIEVFADKTLVGKGATDTFTLTFASVSDPTKVDVVKATVIAK